MKKPLTQKIRNGWKPLLTALLGVGVFFACLLPYRAVMNYHEQRHMFRWTGYYLREQWAADDGWREFFVSFVTQFFHIGWLGAAVVALLAVALQLCIWWCLKKMRLGRSWLYPLTLIPSLALFYYGFIPSEYKTDNQVREAVDYDYLVRAQKWNAILRRSWNHPPETTNGIWATNYALAKKGLLLEKMFHYKQVGPDGLLMDAVRMDPLALYSLSDIALDLGMVNSADRFAFDAKQRLPNNHKSGRLYQRLAETNLVNGNDKVARKYLDILRSTLFYGAWAKKAINLYGNEQALKSDERLGRLRSFRQKENDELAYAKDQMLEELARENPENTLAADYLMAYKLLRLDLEGVTQLVQERTNYQQQRAPKAVQECIAGHWLLSHPNDSLPIGIDQSVFETTVNYMNTINTTGNRQDPSLDTPPYNQSYWHYHAWATTQLRQGK
ncbi:MAG: hypothetical protein IKW98_02520 [Prevotella sp.]|nr:hypothetical protein [Prevotella sp.]